MSSPVYQVEVLDITETNANYGDPVWGGSSNECVDKLKQRIRTLLPQFRDRIAADYSHRALRCLRNRGFYQLLANWWTLYYSGTMTWIQDYNYRTAANLMRTACGAVEVRNAQAPLDDLAAAYLYSYGILGRDYIAQRVEMGLPNRFSFIMDKACNVLRDYAGRICQMSTFIHAWSPISLVFEGEITDSLTFSSFPLIPSEKGRWYEWRASPSAPLLVFDPEKTGVVTDATSLFGNFTFGKEWKNGFEALGSLDSNGDGKLTDGELEKLALWSDDGDGIAGKGEVSPIRSAGITALFYRNPVKTANGDLEVAIGFERKVDGKKTSGKAVDWYARSFTTREDAIGFHHAAALGSSAPAQGGDEPLNRSARADAMRALWKEFPVPQLDVTGLWEFTGEGAWQNGKPKGLLSFYDKGVELTGSSTLAFNMPANSSGADSQVMVGILSGTKSMDSMGRLHLRFAISKSKAGSTKGASESNAVMSEDGKTLTGKTIVELGRTSQGTPIVQTYGWTAVRVEEKTGEAG